MMLYDFDMEKHIESEKAYEYERGREQGREEGKAEGWLMMLQNLMDSMHISEQEARKYLGLNEKIPGSIKNI